MSLIRSAREIAAERAEKAGRLSDEERVRLKAQEMEGLGAALVEKYLSSGDGRVLQEAFDRCAPGEREVLGRVVLEWLLRAVDLRSPDVLETVIRGIKALPGAENLAAGTARLRDVFTRYQAAEGDIRGQIDREGREVLHRLRIAGSAIDGINIRARVEWEEKVKGMSAPFVQELETVKRELLAAAG